MPIATKPGVMVTHTDGFPVFRLHDPLVIFSQSLSMLIALKRGSLFTHHEGHLIYQQVSGELGHVILQDHVTI